MSTKDKVTNWYKQLPKHFKKESGKDTTFKNHLVKPNSMMLICGQTGSGKSNALVDYISRSSGSFYDIIIYTGSSKDEPLYRFLQSKMEGIQFIDKVEELPRVENFKDSQLKDKRKLIVFDDTICEDKKTLKAIEKWYICARKLHFTCVFLSQNFHSTPLVIRRNVHYIILFKMNDTRDVKNVLSKFCTDIDFDTLKNMLNFCTKEPMNFLTIACNDPESTKYRCNFTDILDAKDFQKNNYK